MYNYSYGEVNMKRFIKSLFAFKDYAIIKSRILAREPQLSLKLENIYFTFVSQLLRNKELTALIIGSNDGATKDHK